MGLNKLMSIFSLEKVNYHLYAGVIVGLFLLISFTGVVYAPLREVTAEITNRFYENFIPEGENFIEHLEAFFWMCMFTVYGYLFSKSLIINKISSTSLWLLFFVLLGFVAFGEEISWGQHIFGFRPPEFVENINAQNEFNIHNLNISAMIGLSNDSFFYYRLSNITRVLNVLFFMICGIIWFVIPILKLKGFFSNFKALACMPMPKKETVLFCGVSFFSLRVIDMAFFDTGEIIELTISLVALMSGLDLLTERRIVLE